MLKEQKKKGEVIMSIFGPVFKRQHGQVQPYIPLGPFQLRATFYSLSF